MDQIANLRTLGWAVVAGEFSLLHWSFFGFGGARTAADVVDHLLILAGQAGRHHLLNHILFDAIGLLKPGKHIRELCLLSGFQGEIPICAHCSGLIRRQARSGDGVGIVFFNQQLIGRITVCIRFHYPVLILHGVFQMLYHIGVCVISRCQGLCHQQRFIRPGRQVEFQTAGGDVASSLHIVEFQRMLSPVNEGVAIPERCRADTCVREQVFQRGIDCVSAVVRRIRIYYLTSGEVDGTTSCGMAAAHVQYQHIINVDPDIVITPEVENHVLAVHFAAAWHIEVHLHGHTKP